MFTTSNTTTNKNTNRSSSCNNNSNSNTNVNYNNNNNSKINRNRNRNRNNINDNNSGNKNNTLTQNVGYYMVYGANDNISLSLIYYSIRISMRSVYSVSRVQKLWKAKILLGVLLSSGSFDDQYHNLDIFILSPKLFRYL